MEKRLKITKLIDAIIYSSIRKKDIKLLHNLALKIPDASVLDFEGLEVIKHEDADDRFGFQAYVMYKGIRVFIIEDANIANIVRDNDIPCLVAYLDKELNRIILKRAKIGLIIHIISKILNFCFCAAMTVALGLIGSYILRELLYNEPIDPNKMFRTMQVVWVCIIAHYLYNFVG